MLPCFCLIGLFTTRDFWLHAHLGINFPNKRVACISAAHYRADQELQTTVPAKVCTSPGHDGSIFRMAAKAWTVAQSAAHPSADLDLPNCHRQSLNYPSSRRIHLPESQQRPHLWPEPARTILRWYRTAESSPPRSALPPCGLESKQRCSRPDLLLVSDCRTVAAKACITPAHDRSIFQNGSKGPFVAWICCTPLSSSRTSELSPQVTVVQYSPDTTRQMQIYCCCRLWLKYQSSKALSVLYALTSSKVLSRQTTVGSRFLAVTSLRYFCPKACWAFVLKSWTVEEVRSVRSSACPFSKARLILNHHRITDVLRSWPTLQNFNNESPIYTVHFEPRPSKNTWLLGPISRGPCELSFNSPSYLRGTPQYVMISQWV